jgi:hypothetical protein
LRLFPIENLVAKILHIILLASVLLSSTGFVLGKHHCQRMEQSKEENGKVASCADMGGCKKGCCTTEGQYYHLDQDQQIPQVGVSLPSCPVAASVIPNWAIQLFANDSHFLQYRTYRPPIVLRDISILFQVLRC